MNSLNCPGCQHPLSPSEAFDHCKVCVPDYSVFSVFCPQCGENSELKVEGGYLLIGVPDGFPEPCFTELGRVEAPTVSVNWNKFSAVVRCGEREWTFGVTDFYRNVHSLD
ncbi:MAG TPA: zinc-ribbon domain-containing protein [Candidatus Dormibacteraeota bacterium]|nr:zinc-ribbon domain-containing protein [Candidatus Dormibacteraeota bacterium]